MHWLRDGDLFSSLAKKLVTTFDELLNKVEKYVTLEEIRKAKKAKSKPRKESECRRNKPES